MHQRLEASVSLRRLAAQQSNLVTGEQAVALGLSRQAVTRLVRDGQWLRIATGLFSTVPTPPTWETLAWGGTLLGGPHARLGPEASGYLYGLLRRPPQPIDVLVPVAAPVRVQGPWRFVRERDGVRPGRSPGSPPRLTAECAVLDLANQRSAGEVAGLVTVAVQKGLTNPERLRRLLDARARQRHRALIEGMLTEVAMGVESYLEMLYLRTVERPHGLPKGERQAPSPDLPYERDVKYDPYSLIVELDGRLGHDGEGRFRDMNRDNRHALRDELTLRFGYFDVSGRACSVAFQVYLALVKRGYPELFLRCRHCVGVPEADLLAA
jgi:putative AbiEi antitoxin of type IV toxin-antitoxin system